MNASAMSADSEAWLEMGGGGFGVLGLGVLGFGVSEFSVFFFWGGGG